MCDVCGYADALNERDCGRFGVWKFCDGCDQNCFFWSKCRWPD